MTTFDRFEGDLAAFIDAETALRPPAGLHAAAMDRARATRQRPGWLVAVRGGTIDAPLADVRPVVPLAFILALLVLLTALAVVGALRRDPPPLAVVNGSIAFQRGTDPGPFRLFVGCGDPATARELVAPGLTSIGWPSWSPDGTRIVFGTNDPAATGSGGRWDIYTMARDGSNPEKLRAATGLVGDPSWSPDGRWIAYGSTEAGVSGIYMMDAASREARLVTATPAGWTDYAPRFSPDGTRLVFVRLTVAGTRSALWVIDVDGQSEPQQITPPTLGPNKGEWSPDGTRILFDLQSYLVEQPGIYTVRPDGTGLHSLGLPNGTDALRDGYSDPVWSPDGKLILLVHGMHQGDTITQVGLATVRADGTGLRWLGDGTGDEHLPDWGTAPC